MSQPSSIPSPPGSQSLSAAGAPTSIGRYLVVGLVGKGAMGEVYAAYDPELNRKVAIKVLRASSADSAEAGELRRRLMREAQAIAKVSHPNVIVVHDVGAFGNQIFVATEFVDGHTLSYWLLAETRPWSDVLRIFCEAGRGLAAAHDKGLVHRDFKPDNVMIGVDGQVRVMDFGLAQTVDGNRHQDSPVTSVLPEGGPDGDVYSTRILGPTRSSSQTAVPAAASAEPEKFETTQAGTISGTPAYMSPEQFLGHDTDARTDQFSFCVALYESLYGERPFRGRTIPDLQRCVLSGEVIEPATRNGVPPGMRKVLLRGLKVSPQERWPSMKALLAALEDNRLFAGRRRLAEGAAAKLSGLWEAPVRGRRVKTAAKEEIRAAFLATGKPYASEAFDNASRILDRYARSWSEMYVAICEATHVRGEQSPEVMDLRMACLMECLEGLRALSRIFKQANAEVVEKAVSAASALGGLERCSDINLLRAGVRPPEDHDTRVAVDRLRGRLAEVRVLYQVGRYIEGLKAMGPLEEEVRRVGYGPLLAETLLVLGKMQAERWQTEVAARALEEAVWTGELCRHEEVAVEAATYLIYVAGEAQLRFDAAEIWSRYAETVLRRIGGHDIVWGWLFNNRGAMRAKQGRFEEALNDTRLSVAAKERAGGVDSPDVALSLNNLALHLVQRGDTEGALPHMERALKILEERLGREHPSTAMILSNYSEILNTLGRFSEARQMSTAALTIFERETEAGGIALTFPLMALGVSYLGIGAPEDALPVLERAATMRDQAETDSALLGESHFALARAVLAVGKDVPRAWTLAEQSRVEYARAGLGAAGALARVDAWMSSAPRG